MWKDVRPATIQQPPEVRLKELHAVLIEKLPDLLHLYVEVVLFNRAQQDVELSVHETAQVACRAAANQRDR